MFSTLLSGLIVVAATSSALVPLEQPPSKQSLSPQSQQSQATRKDPYTNLFSRTEVPTKIPTSPVPFVISTPVTEVTVPPPTQKCHARMIPIDPLLDAKIRVQIPDEKLANSKIRRIALPCSR
jgi:hypothetical protein